MAELERIWREMGVVKISFSTEIANDSAMRFYEHLGYELRSDIRYVSKVLRTES